VFAVESECSCNQACILLFQKNILSDRPRTRAGRFLFDDIFGIDIVSGDTDDENLRNCTCGTNSVRKDFKSIK
jgi:hypothetical protein